MNIKLLILSFLIISPLIVTDSFADSYKAQGELYFENNQGGGKATRSFKLSVVSEVPVNIIMGDKTITLTFTVDPPPSINYSLTVSLSTKPKSSHEFSGSFFTKTYQSTLVGGSNGPFEFEEQHDEIKLGGVIALNLRN